MPFPVGSRLFLLVLVVATATGPLAMQIFVPALPSIQRAFAVPASTAQLTLSLSILAIAVSTLVYGPLSDRFGRRPVLLAGMLLFLAGSVVCAVADGIGWLIVGRVVQAAGAAAGMVLGRAIVRDVYPAGQVPQVLATLITAVVVAPMVAPALGGALADHAGWRSVFGFTAGFGVLVVALVWWRLGETNRQPTQHPRAVSMLTGYGRLLQSRRFMAYALQGAFAMATFYGFLAAAPYLMVNVLARPATEYGLWFVMMPASFMAGNMLAVRLGGRAGIDRMVLGGSLLGLAAALAGLALVAGGWFSPLTLFGPAMLISISHGLTMANAQAGAMNVEPAMAGAASGLSAFLQMALSAAAAQLVGMLPTDTPYPMLLVMVACMTASLVLFAALHGGLRRRPGLPCSEEATAS